MEDRDGEVYYSEGGRRIGMVRYTIVREEDRDGEVYYSEGGRGIGMVGYTIVREEEEDSGGSRKSRQGGPMCGAKRRRNFLAN